MLISLPKSAYSTECINRAAYNAAILGSIRISESSSAWDVELQPRTPDDSQSFLQEFQTNLSDECLREVLRSRTENLRSLILAHAYSNTRIANEDAPA
jgi:His-Xaa-Ser system protein HxsD